MASTSARLIEVAADADEPPVMALAADLAPPKMADTMLPKILMFRPRLFGFA
jgi:hypothetical protein